MTRSGWWVVLLLAACSKAEPTSGDPREPGVAPASPEVDVVLAGVTLADDCGDGVDVKPPAPPPSAAGSSAGSSSVPVAPAASSERVSAGACAPGMVCGVPPRACEQTAMQLAVRVPAGAPATTLRIKRVELLDDKGAVLGTLAARAPSKWDGKAAYLPWNEAIPAGKDDFAISYKLSSPDWNALTGGRWNAAARRFALRVTVAVRDKDRTIEKQAIVPMMPEPAVST